MTLQQLEYIIALDMYGSFTDAAQSCGVTQSTLSLMVKRLEEELDTTIFLRDSHPIKPTETGRRIIDEARLVLYHAGQISELTRSEKELVSGKLRVGMISTVSPVLMPAFFRFFSQKYPDVRLQAYEMISDTIKEKLYRAEIDMGIMSAPLNDDNFLEVPLYHEKFFAYVSPKEQYSDDVIERDILTSKRIWIMGQGVQLYDSSMLKAGETFTYNRMYEGGRVFTLIKITNEIGGYTIVPELHIPLIKEDQKQCLRPIVNPEVSRKIILVIRRDYVHEHMMNAVIEAVKSVVPPHCYESIIKSDYVRL